MNSPHGKGYEGSPAQPGGPGVIESTTVTIVTDPPKDYVIWSLCNFFHNNHLCLGLVALIYSIKSRDRRMVGDLEGAQHNASIARSINIAASIVGVVVFIAIIIFVSSFRPSIRFC